MAQNLCSEQNTHVGHFFSFYQVTVMETNIETSILLIQKVKSIALMQK